MTKIKNPPEEPIKWLLSPEKVGNPPTRYDRLYPNPEIPIDVFMEKWLQLNEEWDELAALWKKQETHDDRKLVKKIRMEFHRIKKDLNDLQLKEIKDGEGKILFHKILCENPLCKNYVPEDRIKAHDKKVKDDKAGYYCSNKCYDKAKAFRSQESKTFEERSDKAQMDYWESRIKAEKSKPKGRGY